MYSDYLKEQLERIVAIKDEIAKADAIFTSGDKYPSICGWLQATIKSASADAERAIAWLTEHIAPAEKQAERLVSILENIGVNLDEDDLVALETLGKDHEYRHDRNTLAEAINAMIANVQESERDIEHNQATDALLAAGFVFDEQSDSFVRDGECAIITLTNGRQSRYEWRFENASGEVDSGKSGSFSRLIALIAPKTQEVVQ